MKKTTRQIQLANKIRYRAIIESNECPERGPHSLLERSALLTAVVDNPSLLDCGPLVFDTMKMYHNGQVWIIEVEATEIGKREEGSRNVPEAPQESTSSFTIHNPGEG